MLAHLACLFVYFVFSVAFFFKEVFSFITLNIVHQTFLTFSHRKKKRAGPGTRKNRALVSLQFAILCLIVKLGLIQTFAQTVRPSAFPIHMQNRSV